MAVSDLWPVPFFFYGFHANAVHLFFGFMSLPILLEGQWQTVARLAGQKRSISCLSCIRLPSHNGECATRSEKDYLIVAGASDGCLMSWKVSIIFPMGRCVITLSIQLSLTVGLIRLQLTVFGLFFCFSLHGATQPIEALQTIQLGNQIALDAALAFLPNQSTSERHLGYFFSWKKKNPDFWLHQYYF
jgi:hypothetical protein